MAGVKHLVAALLYTPLSPAQRGLVTEITGALDGCRNSRMEAGRSGAFPIEPPTLRTVRFNLAHAVTGAFAEAQKAAELSGAKVQAALVGFLPETVHGASEHIQRLITLLTPALREVAETSALELQASVTTKSGDAAELVLQWSVSSPDGASSLLARVKAITAASGTLQAAQTGEAEAGLAAAWQLALTLGGTPSVEAHAEEVRVRVMLPIATSSTSSAALNQTVINGGLERDSLQETQLVASVGRDENGRLNGNDHPIVENPPLSTVGSHKE
jgi:hypothetical protein